MTGTTLANLFRKPATLMYPFKVRQYYAATRGHITIESEKCIFCTICAKKCPTDAISVNREAKEWMIDHFKCIACGSCIDNCPKKCLKMHNQYRAPLDDAGKKDMIEVHHGA